VATCPACHEFLGDGHRCDGAQRRKRRRRLVVTATGIGGSVLAFALPKEPSALWILAAGVMGTMVAQALWRE
jgi:hypothetical protein